MSDTCPPRDDTRGYPNPFDLTGRVALVTGAGGGLGAAFSRALVDAGAIVACADRNESSARRVADALKSNGFDAMAMDVDVTDESSVASMTAGVLERYGRVDVLVNNAGIAEVRAVPLESVKVEHWRRVMAVDLDGVFLCCRAVLGHMAERGSGKIVNVASMYGLHGSRSTAISAYAAAKGAVVNLTREVAMQYAGSNVQVNAVCPGFIRTGLGGGIYEDPETLAALESQVPMGRIADPDELRGALLMLASAASDYMTGQTLVIDGGVSAG